MSDEPRLLDIKEIGEITVVTFVHKKLPGSVTLQQLRHQLVALIDEDGRKKIVLDFSNVEYLPSTAFGMLVTLGKKVKTANGKLRLCCLAAEVIEEVFQIARWQRLFDYKPTLEEALEGF